MSDVSQDIFAFLVTIRRHLLGCFATYQILLGWETYKYDETVETPQRKANPTQ